VSRTLSGPNSSSRPFVLPKTPISTTVTDDAVEQLGVQGDAFTDPFFYQDARYGFCVETSLATVIVPNAPYGWAFNPPPKRVKVPPLVVYQPPHWIDPGDPIERVQPVESVDPAAMGQLVQQGNSLRIGFAGGSAVQVGNVVIGALGAITEEAP